MPEMHKMLTQNAVREITPLTQNDCFSISSRTIREFDVPLHYHDEYELSLILNGKGAKRVVGNSIEIINNVELVFIGPNLYHTWFTHQCTSDVVTEVTIKFHKDLFNETFLKRNQLCLLKSMFNNAQRGISFSEETVVNTIERIMSLKQKKHFEAVLELLNILHILSVCSSIKLLSDTGFSDEKFSYKSRRIEKVFDFLCSNYEKNITLAEVAALTNMPATSFSRFFKRMTGKTFVESLNEIRLGHASRMLVETNLSVSNIAYKCGFNNISYFNRTFKHKKLCIPSEFRETYATGKRVYI
jgi:AraC-like DNA-binding protein